MSSMDKADNFNDKALMEDPDYAKALMRKIMIMEKKGDYEQGY